MREAKALYDNLHPSRSVVGVYDHQKKIAQKFAELLLGGACTEERRAGQKQQNTSKGISIIDYEPTLENGSELFRNKAAKTLGEFKAQRNAIFANCFDQNVMDDVADKV